MVAFRCGCAESPSPWEPVYGPAFPSDQMVKLVEVLYIKDIGPVITACSGPLGYHSIDEIQSQLSTDAENGNLEYYNFDKGDGNYLYNVTYQPPQYGEYGTVEIPEYWDFDALGFKPIRTHA
jgi:hypothetical protein